ncbi:MAG: phosphatidylserine/phosphatidylglycerophosphate/cardiolipin synthase family protein [Candidatus Buchananbacteria bacterium]
MNYHFYATSEKAWDAMLSSIKQAEKSIYIEMFIFLDDTYESHDFFSLLKAKALQGLEVKVIVDAYGSKGLTARSVAELRATGVEVLFFSQWFRRIHKKVVIVDGKFGFIGGVNIGKYMRLWDDLQLKVSGAVVRSLLASFARAYKICGGRDLTVARYLKNKKFKRAKFWLVENWSESGIFTLKDFYEEKINQAQQSIIIVTPYFLPKRWLMAMLDTAVKRGVKVLVLIPQRSDLIIINRINFWFCSKLLANGVKFYLGQTMNHAKVFLIDNNQALVGSQNIDFLSFDYNIETGVFFTDQKIIADLSKIVEGWLAVAVEFNPQKYQPRWYDKLIGLALRLLSPWL